MDVDIKPDTGTAPDLSVEELLGLLARMAGHEPHVCFRQDSGPLAPLAEALHRLSAQRSSARTSMESAFGMQSLIEQSPNIMFTCDDQARIRFVNLIRPPYTLADIIGTSIYQWTAPAAVEVARATVETVLATGEPATYEAQPLGLPGVEWLSSLVGPIKVGTQVVGFTITLTDISGLKRTQQRLERSNRELEGFAYVASHDLQEPLRKIQTFGERLKTTSAAALSDEGRGYIDRMQKAATRMRELLDDLLAFSRVSTHPKPFAPVNLEAVAHEVLEDLEARLEQTGGHITVGALPELQADATQMRQLLQNLLSNGLKFRREGVPPVLSVQASVDPRTQTCELRVEDNGIGFEEKYADRIFSVFQRLHGRGQYEGSGIGLAICRKIVERHEGRITARSTPGVGSTFLVTLPLAPPPPG